MSEEIQPFKIEDAAKQLREKIRLAYVEMIPPAQWEAMVKQELESFTKERANPNYNGYSGTPRTLPGLFHEVASEVYREHVKALFKAELAKPEWNSKWDGTRQEMGAMVKEWLTENSQALLQVTIKEMFGYAAQELLNRLNR
jgi:hypothetical protein